MAVAMLAVTGACVHTVSTTLSTETPPPHYVAATRSAADCAALTVGAAADAYAVTTLGKSGLEMSIPVPREVLIPDHTRYGAWTGPTGTATVEMRVTERGVVVHDSVRVRGIGQNAYATELMRVARRTEYWPAVREGCAVPAWATMEFSTPGRP